MNRAQVLFALRTGQLTTEHLGSGCWIDFDPDDADMVEAYLEGCRRLGIPYDLGLVAEHLRP